MTYLCHVDQLDLGMPIYEYLCTSCGLKIEKLWKSISTAQDSLTCEECGENMKKLVSAANFSFAHKPTGPVPQNTGVHAIDYSFDQVIGRDSEQKWKTIEKRGAAKDSVIRDERKAGKVVTRDHLIPKGNGEYRVMKEEERTRINQNRDAVFKIEQEAKKQKAAEKTSKKESK